MALSGPGVRWYGWAAVLGGVLFAASDFAARLLVAALDGGGAATGGYVLWTTLSLLSLALLQLALIGLYSPHRQTAGTVGWVGFFLASAGIAVAFFVVSVYAFIALPGTPDDPELLGAGPPPWNPDLVLEASSTESVLRRAARRYDVIVVSAPPVLRVADTLLLSRIADGVVLVADRRRTSRDDLTEGFAVLDVAGARVLGVVLRD